MKVRLLLALCTVLLVACSPAAPTPAATTAPASPPTSAPAKPAAAPSASVASPSASPAAAAGASPSAAAASASPSAGAASPSPAAAAKPIAVPSPPPNAANGPLTPVRIAAIISAGQGIFSTAVHDSGIDKQYGLDVQVVEISTTGQQWISLRGGNADVASGSVLDLLRQRQAGLQARAFGTFQTYNNPIVVLPDSPIKSFADLSGKKIGTPDPNLLDFLIIRSAGKKAFGVDVGTQATPVPAAPNLLNELLMRNQIDAALNFSSLTAAPVASGQLRQLTTVPDLMQQAGFNPQSFYLLLTATDSWSQQNPGAMARMHDAEIATFQMLMTQDAPWTTLAQQVGITDPAQVKNYMQSQRAILVTDFSPQLVAATTSLLNDIISVAGADAVGINSVDPNAFAFAGQ